MKRRLAGLALIFFAGLASCGGGGVGALPDFVLVEFEFVDRDLRPVASPGTPNLPRNAMVLLTFSQTVDEDSVSISTVQIREGVSSSNLPPGALLVSGNQVVYDPTSGAEGRPSVWGFVPNTAHSVLVRGSDQGGGTVRSETGAPLEKTVSANFTTSSSLLNDFDPPQVLGLTFVPGIDPVTGLVASAGYFQIEFDEAMDESSFLQGGVHAPLPGTTVDVRYDGTDPVAQGAGVAGRRILCLVAHNGSARTWRFVPIFSLGDLPFTFHVNVLAGVRDLSGNRMGIPVAFGPFTCDGVGSAPGSALAEPFGGLSDRSDPETDADWGETTVGRLEAMPITSRKAHVYGYTFADHQGTSGNGMYIPVVSPLIGTNFGAANPPAAAGRRLMQSFTDAEIGASGAVTGVAWGPELNATWAAQYPNVKLRMGYQKDDDLNLRTFFSDNYESAPVLIYDGPYQVQQAANVGNPAGEPAIAHKGPYGACANGNYNLPLFQYVGWVDWPAPTALFEWDEGDPSVQGDRVLLFDASVAAGTDWQTARGWWGVLQPCNPVPNVDVPLRRLYGTYEGSQANPSAGPLLANPENSYTDTSFTITRNKSVAQSLFYTPAGSAVVSANGETLGAASDYGTPIVEPPLPSGTGQVLIEFQGAVLVLPDRKTIDTMAPSTPWTTNIDDCDGFGHIRWRLTLRADLTTMRTPTVHRVIIPIRPR